jgi:hypothetical protein
MHREDGIRPSHGDPVSSSCVGDMFAALGNGFDASGARRGRVPRHQGQGRGQAPGASAASMPPRRNRSATAIVISMKVIDAVFEIIIGGFQIAIP